MATSPQVDIDAAIAELASARRVLYDASQERQRLTRTNARNLAAIAAANEAVADARTRVADARTALIDAMDADAPPPAVVSDPPIDVSAGIPGDDL